MTMTFVSAVIGAIASALTTIFGNLCDNVWDFWIPVLLFVGYTVAAAFCIILAIFIASLFIDAKKPLKKISKFWWALYNFVNPFLIFWAGADVKITEKEKLGDGPYLFVVNHRSNFDTMLISKIYRKYDILMISKPGNFKIPIAGAAIYKSGFLCMPKDDPKGSLGVVTKAVDYLKEGKYSIGLCPEGTRNKTGTNLLPFKNGCLKIATRSEVPIVVICINGTENIHKHFPFKRTKVYFDLIKVIKPEDYSGKTTAQIGDEIRALMQEKIDEHN